MEDKRSERSGIFGVERRVTLNFSPVSLTASVSVVALVIVIFWNATRPQSIVYQAPSLQGQTEVPASASFASASHSTSATQTTPTDLSQFAPQVIGALASQYDALQKDGSYTPAKAAAAAAKLAPLVKAPISYKTFSIIDIKTTDDTSHARMEKYQADLRTAFAPLTQNTTPEIAIVSAYAQTHDQKYLDQLRSVAGEYRDSAQAATAIVVPLDAVEEHLAILNAMQKFSATLSAFTSNISDPITVMALLQSYNDAEGALITADNSLASYVAHHSPV